MKALIRTYITQTNRLGIARRINNKRDRVGIAEADMSHGLLAGTVAISCGNVMRAQTRALLALWTARIDLDAAADAIAIDAASPSPKSSGGDAATRPRNVGKAGASMDT